MFAAATCVCDRPAIEDGECLKCGRRESVVSFSTIREVEVAEVLDPFEDDPVDDPLGDEIPDPEESEDELESNDDEATEDDFVATDLSPIVAAVESSELVQPSGPSGDITPKPRSRKPAKRRSQPVTVSFTDRMRREFSERLAVLDAEREPIVAALEALAA